MKIYAIYDKRKNEFMKNGAKGIWLTKGAAKNAVMLHASSLDKDDYKRRFTSEEVTKDWLNNNHIWERRYLAFADQARYECREYDLKDIGFVTV